MQLDLAEAAFGTTATVEVRLPGRVRPLRGLRLRARHAPGALRRAAAAPARCARSAGRSSARSSPRRRASRAARPGSRIPTPCHECRGDGRVARVAQHRRRGPAGHRRRPAAPAHRPRSRPRRAAASPATSTSPCASRPHPTLRAPRRRSRARAHDRDDPGRARHASRRRHARRPEELIVAARHPARSRVPAQGPRRARRCSGRGRGDLLVRVDVEVPDAALGRGGRAAARSSPSSAARRSPRRRTRASSPGSGPPSSSGERRVRRTADRGRPRDVAATAHVFVDRLDDRDHRRRRRRPSPAARAPARARARSVTAADGYGRWRVLRGRRGRRRARSGSRATSAARARAARSTPRLDGRVRARPRATRPELVVAAAHRARRRPDRAGATRARSVVRWDGDRGATARGPARAGSPARRRCSAAGPACPVVDGPVAPAELAGQPGPRASPTPTACRAAELPRARPAASGWWWSVPRAASTPGRARRVRRRPRASPSARTSCARRPRRSRRPPRWPARRSMCRSSPVMSTAESGARGVDLQRYGRADSLAGGAGSVRWGAVGSHEWTARRRTPAGDPPPEGTVAPRRRGALRPGVQGVRARRLRAGRAGHLGAAPPPARRDLRGAARPAPARGDADIEINLTEGSRSSTPASPSTWCGCTRSTTPRPRCCPRYAATIQLQRQDFNGRLLTIRRDDLRVLAAVLGRRPDDLGVPARRARPPRRHDPA